MKKILSLLAALLFFSCQKSQPANNTCSGSICTAEFRTVALYLRSASGTPFIPDSVRVLYPEGTVLNTPLVRDPANRGNYQIINDARVTQYPNHTDTFRFSAFYRGKVVVDTPFVIHTDCCHITKISGPDTVVVP